MKYPTVSALCEGVAGAIRAKEGSTEKINPQDFPQRIENLQVGGGTSEDKWRYFDCKQVPIESRVEILAELESMIIKAQSISYNTIMSSAKVSYIEDASAIVAFGADMSIETNVSGEFTTLGKLYEMVTDMLAQAGIIEITKEQFYTLE
jgi:hypothetical protein